MATIDPALVQWYEGLSEKDQNEFRASVVAEAEKIIADARKMSFREFVGRVNPRYQWYPYVERLATVLDRVITGELNRVMIFMPPRHGKSELVSRLFSAYYLYRFPERFVGINSYAADLAYTFSRASRDNYTRVGGILKGDASAVKHWETKKGGGLWAAGVGGPITGKGFSLGIIDDPVKNAEEAASEPIRKKQQEWYDSTFYTREEPGAAIIIIQTRWHEDDLSGWLLGKEKADEEPENWHIVHFEALKEESPLEYPKTCSVEFDKRQAGEALAPLRYNAKKLQKIANRIGSYFFGALFQQRPKPREGNMFKREWFEVVNAIPSQAQRVRYWDKAGTQDGGAFSCGVLIARGNEGIFYIEDMIRGQWSAGQREKVIKQTAKMDGKSVAVWHEQEPGSGGKESAENTTKSLVGYSVFADKVTGDKVIRAEPLAAQCEAANVKIKKADWNYGYLERLTAFPAGTYKDDVDASSGAFNKLATHDVSVMGLNEFLRGRNG